MDEVYGPSEGVCSKINLIWSHSMRVSWSAYELFSLSSYIYIYIYKYTLVYKSKAGVISLFWREIRISTIIKVEEHVDESISEDQLKYIGQPVSIIIDQGHTA